ncbi:Uncharacterised protein [uncultured Clostridium sp.]|nr:Uncharacterised protein [uncultured Clostridium sp.]
MSERERKITETIAAAVDNMSDFGKGYLLGMGEAMVMDKKEKAKAGDAKAGEDNEIQR